MPAAQLAQHAANENEAILTDIERAAQKKAAAKAKDQPESDVRAEERVLAPTGTGERTLGVVQSVDPQAQPPSRPIVAMASGKSPTSRPPPTTAAPVPSASSAVPTRTRPATPGAQRGVQSGDQQRRREIADEFARSQRGIAGEPGYRRDDPKWSKQSARAEENAVYGALNEVYLREALRRQLAADFDMVSDQVRIRPNLANGQPAKFYFIADHLAHVPGTSNHMAIEGKLTEKAGLTPNQSSGYPLLERYGGTVISRNVHQYPYGTVLPPTSSVRAEPTVDLKTTPRPAGQDIIFRLGPIQ
ncbi:MAG: hypothetical protein ACRDJT_10580 [Actinomycetota bacterium]